MIKEHKIELLREVGVDPLTGELYPMETEAFTVEATSVTMAYELAQIKFKMRVRGQTLRFFVDGREYFDDNQQKK